MKHEKVCIKKSKKNSFFYISMIFIFVCYFLNKVFKIVEVRLNVVKIVRCVSSFFIATKHWEVFQVYVKTFLLTKGEKG